MHETYARLDDLNILIEPRVCDARADSIYIYNIRQDHPRFMTLNSLQNKALHSNYCVYPRQPV